MADIFISYARQAQGEAERIAGALAAEGYEVWWDTRLLAHEAFARVIEDNLRAAKAVVVIWTRDAVQSEWVRAEADLARTEKKLVQIALDGVQPPLPFNQIQCVDLQGWAGDSQRAEWRKVLVSLGQLTGRSPPAPAVYEPPASAARAPPGSLATALSLPAMPSIVVLPFKNMSGDPEQEYLADAITEDVVTALSRWRWFFVIARGSSFQYKGLDVDPATVGADLGVRYVLEGSVRKVGGRVRVTAQLIEAAGATHIWSERFDRDLVDILDLQDEITERIVTAVEPTMLHTENLRIARTPVADVSALDCFQRGMWLLNKVSEAGYHEAMALFRRAVALDPELSLGHVGLARMLYGGAVMGWCDTPVEDLLEGLNSAQRAIGLDPRDAYGYYAAAGNALYLGEHQMALEHAHKTVQVNPNFGLGHFRLGQVLLYAGHAAEAVEPFERSLRFSPYDPQMGSMLEHLALAHYQAKDYPAALPHAAAAAHLGNVRGSLVLAASLARLKRDPEAAEALPASTDPPLSRGRALAAPYARAEDRDHWRDGLRLARHAARAAS